MSSDPNQVPGKPVPESESTTDQTAKPASEASAATAGAPTAEAPAASTPTIETPAVAAAAVPAAAATKIAIGSQRDVANKSLSPAKPKAVQQAAANPTQLAKPEEAVVVEAAPVEIKSDTGFSEDIDAEIEAALGEISMDDVVENTEASKKELESNTRVKAAVTKVHDDNVFVKLEGQFEGIATLHHFKEAPKEGDLVEVIIRGLNKEDGLYELAVPGASIGVSD